MATAQSVVFSREHAPNGPEKKKNQSVRQPVINTYTYLCKKFCCCRRLLNEIWNEMIELFMECQTHEQIMKWNNWKAHIESHD